MAQLDQLIDSTILEKGELAQALNQLKQDPQQLQLFLQGQQDNVFKDIIKQKDVTFDKVYGEMKAIAKAQQSVVSLDQRNKDLASIQEEIYNTQKQTTNTLEQEKDVSERKFEMNEWSVNNKKETLFMYSMLFVLLSVLILLTVCWRTGVISAGLCGGLMVPFVLFFLFTLIYRSKYTNVYRNKRYWNERQFMDKYGKIALPSICPEVSPSENSM